ncbi:MAG: hypothetical protein QXD48_02895 [Candidatus Aenigmatarchaeota archaeon]
MNKRIKGILVFILIMFLLFTTIFISGCIESKQIKTSEEAGQAIENISSGIEDLSSTLEDIDKNLG